MIEIQENDDGAIRLFGPTRWGHSIVKFASTPVGEPCFRCEVPIAKDDFGLTMIYMGEETARVAEHRECFLRSIGVSDPGDTMPR